MADWPPLKNSAFTVTFPIYDADGDLVSAAASLDSEVSKDGGTFTDVSPGEASEIATSSGIYTLALSATEMNADIVCTITKTATGGAKTAVNVMYTVSRQLADLAYPTTSGRSIDVETTGEVGINLDNVVGTLDAAEIGADAITAAKIADAAIDAATFAAGAIDAAAIATDAVDADALAADAVAEINATVDTALSDYDALVPADLPSNFASMGIEADGHVHADVKEWLGVAPNALQSGRVDAYAGAMAAAVIAAATFSAGAIDASAIAADAIGSSEIATGAIDADAIAADAITAAKIATDAISNDEIAASAANEIADAILSRDVDQVEGSAAVHTLCTAILKAVSRIRDNAGTLEIYRTNGTTIHMSQTVTTDSGLDPVDELTVGS